MRLRKEAEARSRRLCRLHSRILYSKGNEKYSQNFNQGKDVTKSACYSDLSGCCVENGLNEDGAGGQKQKPQEPLSRRWWQWCTRDGGGLDQTSGSQGLGKWVDSRDV